VCPSWDWKPTHGLYSLPYLQPEPQKNEEESGYLTQAEWWELLFFIKKLDVGEQQPIFQNLHEKLDEEVPEAQELWAEGCAGLELGTASGGVWGGGRLTVECHRGGGGAAGGGGGAANG
jgi:hypothetical protein